MKILESILQIMREEEQEEIMDANNVTADMFSIVFSPQGENQNVVVASEKLEILNDLVNAVVHMTINNIAYD